MTKSKPRITKESYSVRVDHWPVAVAMAAVAAAITWRWLQ